MDEKEVIAVQTDREPAVLRLIGAIDVRHAARLHDAAVALADRGADTVVECQELERLETSALQILLALKASLDTRGASLRLEGLSDATRSVVRLAGLTTAFDLAPAAH